MEFATSVIVLPVLQAFFEGLITSVLQSKSHSHVLNVEVRRLQHTLEAISCIHDDAERRHLEDANLRKWLQDLKVELYNTRDLLDEVNYKYLKWQSVHLSKVRNTSLNPKRLYFAKTMAAKVIEANKTLEGLLGQSSNFNLQRRCTERRPQETISVGDKIVFSREEDSKTILNFLLSNYFSTANADFITICGKAGIGKTTLGQMVFNHESLVGHFHTKMWVHASSQDGDNKINAQALIKATIQSITSNSCGLQSLDAMRNHLQRLLERKKYLLVLDDLVNGTDGFLRVVKNVLINVGANGSKILITTQNRSINKFMNPTHTHELKSLCKYDCAQVIKAYAIYDGNPDAHLNRITEKLVDKCDGSPLIALKYGMLLMKTKREDWESILETETREVIKLEYDIMQTLPYKMKMCLAYCTIFPTYFKFDKEQLAQQWWAQGFVSTEDEARDYFDSMINWSLIQRSCFDLSKTQQTYIMCDNVRHRVQQIADKEYHVMHSGNNHRISEFTHHVSLLINPCESSLPANQPSIELVYEAKALYTLMLLVIPVGPVSIQVPDDLGSNLKCLRTLDLSHLDIHELPSSIGDLKHLRYLSICNTKIKRLPNSVSKLYHLHSLRLRNCYELIELPKDTRNLTNLHHLDLHLDEDSERKGGLISMPREIGKLTSLQTLSRFVVSTNSSCGIRELRGMKNLHGDLTISNLESVRNPADAKEANLKSKDHLQMLELKWTKDARDLRIEKEVLHHLQPHNNIQELKIGAYSGCSLPSWISDRSFSKLVTIKIYDCKNISDLPHLEELPSLEMIYIESLPKWRTWCQHADDNFASLHKIVIRDCIKLSQLSVTLPALENSEIDRCPHLIGLPRLPSLHSLKVKDSGDWIWSSLRCLNSLSSLFLSELSTTTPTVELQNCTSLQHLEISNFKSLCYLSDDWLPPNITYLKIEHCPRLQALPLLNLIALEDLQIQHCEELLSLLMGGLPCLGHFEISECPKISDMLSDGLPVRLQILSIDQCPELEKCSSQIERTQSLSIWINGDLKVLAEEKEIHSGASTSQGR